VRRLRRDGPPRPDVIGAERVDWAFLRYVATFDRTRRAGLFRDLGRQV
jgi:hypothetical protein